MSFGSKLALASSIVFATSACSYVHWKQGVDRKNLKEGVVKDMERQASKRKNIKELQEQRELEKALKKQRAEENRQAELNQAGT